MAFHYQNLIQEKDFKNEDNLEKYMAIKKYALHSLFEFKITHPIITGKHLWKLAIESSKNASYQNFSFHTNLDKILIITNILIPDDEYFIQKLISYYHVDLEKCYKLREVFNELDKKDKDFLDGTMEGLVRYYIPNFDVIAQDLKMNINDEFIIYKLFEIMHFKNELLEDEKQKNIGKK